MNSYKIIYTIRIQNIRRFIRDEYKYRGVGKTIYEHIIRYAFDILNLNSIIALRPPGRKNLKGLTSLGFEKEDKRNLEGSVFLCYRLIKEKYNNLDNLTDIPRP